jgi:hypothetical protein
VYIPEFVVVNVNAPMPASRTHVDVPSFHGATREHYPLPFLIVMGSSGLFEAWRVVQAGSISWFYEGTGGNFDYWPEGLGHRFRIAGASQYSVRNGGFVRAAGNSAGHRPVLPSERIQIGKPARILSRLLRASYTHLDLPS